MVLESSIEIAASRARVWELLGTLDALERYDPGVARSKIMSRERTGVGATRQCDLKPGGWFRERVTTWQRKRALGFELFECTLPVKRLKHDYVLTSTETGTRVQQRMEYRLKFGPLGLLMDAAIVRRRWKYALEPRASPVLDDAAAQLAHELLAERPGQRRGRGHGGETIVLLSKSSEHSMHGVVEIGRGGVGCVLRPVCR